MAFPQYFSFILCLFAWPTLAAISSLKFQSWYPQCGLEVQAVIQQNCSAVYNAFMTSNVTEMNALAQASAAERQPLFTQDKFALYDPLMNCILDALRETVKSNMAATAVFLGLMPSIFSTVGSSTAEMALLSLVARRPLLSFFLSAGSPAVAPLRSFQYPNPTELLQPQNQGAVGVQFPRYRRAGRVVVTVVEYALAMTAVVNVYHVTYTLAIQTIVSIYEDVFWAQPLWAVSAIPIHLFGCISYWLLVQVNYSDDESKKDSFSIRQLMWRCAKLEFTPTAYREPPRIKPKQKTTYFLIFSWITEIVTLAHILYGTTVFSSTIFICSTDALVVACRYLTSAVCCRMILAYEVAGLKQAYDLRGSRLDFTRAVEGDDRTMNQEVQAKQGQTWVTTSHVLTQSEAGFKAS